MEKKELCLGIVIALITLSFIPQLCSAALVWSESFEDLNDWCTAYCKLEDGRLRGEEGFGISLYRSSTVSAGTWKIELELIEDWVTGGIYDRTRVYFMSPEPLNITTSFLSLTLRPASTTDGTYFSYTIEKSLNAIHTQLDTYDGEVKATTIGILHRFAITRTTEGLITVYLNDTQILQAADTDITTTQYFGFWTLDDWAVDNIEVFDSIEVGGGLPWLLIAAGVGVPIILIAAALLIRRK